MNKSGFGSGFPFSGSRACRWMMDAPASAASILAVAGRMQMFWMMDDNRFRHFKSSCAFCARFNTGRRSRKSILRAWA